MSNDHTSLFTIAHDANDHFLKLYESSVTTVGLLDTSIVCIDCLISRVRILAIQLLDPVDTIRIVIGDKEMGEVKNSFDLDAKHFSSMDLLKVMEERFAKAQPTAAN